MANYFCKTFFPMTYPLARVHSLQTDRQMTDDNYANRSTVTWVRSAKNWYHCCKQRCVRQVVQLICNKSLRVESEMSFNLLCYQMTVTNFVLTPNRWYGVCVRTWEMTNNISTTLKIIGSTHYIEVFTAAATEGKTWSLNAVLPVSVRAKCF